MLGSSFQPLCWIKLIKILVKVGRIMAPQKCRILLPETRDYVTLHGKGDSELGTLRLRTFKWEDDPGLGLVAQPNHMSPRKWRVLPSWANQKDAMWEGLSCHWWLCRWRGGAPRGGTQSVPRRWKRHGNTFPKASGKECVLTDTLVVVPWDLCQTPDYRINQCVLFEGTN